MKLKDTEKMGELVGTYPRANKYRGSRGLGVMNVTG